jgi:aspartate carbamoyltransferase catalytic subunit
VEIAAEVADLPRSVILDQVRNGVAVRMAVLYLLLGAGTGLVPTESAAQLVTAEEHARA